MQKYSHLIFGGLIVAGAIFLIVWVMKQQGSIFAEATANAVPLPSPDTGVEPLNGLEPNNAQVTVAQPFLTYNVPEPGTVNPIDPNSDFITSQQLNTIGVNTADWSVGNLLAVNLPPNDFVN